MTEFFHHLISWITDESAGCLGTYFPIKYKLLSLLLFSCQFPSSSYSKVLTRWNLSHFGNSAIYFIWFQSSIPWNISDTTWSIEWWFHAPAGMRLLFFQLSFFLTKLPLSLLTCGVSTQNSYSHQRTEPNGIDRHRSITTDVSEWLDIKPVVIKTWNVHEAFSQFKLYIHIELVEEIL